MVLCRGSGSPRQRLQQLDYYSLPTTLCPYSHARAIVQPTCSIVPCRASQPPPLYMKISRSIGRVGWLVGWLIFGIAHPRAWLASLCGILGQLLLSIKRWQFSSNDQKGELRVGTEMQRVRIQEEEGRGSGLARCQACFVGAFVAALDSKE